MIEKDTDLISLIQKALGNGFQENFEEIGVVVKIGDGIAHAYGLKNAMYGELITFEGGNQGIILDLEEDIVSIVLLNKDIPVIEQETARRTGGILRVPVGDALLGRVVNAIGEPLDARGEIVAESYMPIEQKAPSIRERTPVNEPLETGIIAIDSLIPIGKGQRELLIGNRNTGKTSIALDIILHQKNKNMICIYVSIGHKQLNTARILNTLEKHKAIEYSIIVDADAQENAINQFIAPYSACTIAEHFMRKGKDVLIIYDSLTNHAIAYRELSLLLRRSPGREAYPGDIFYIHSRLLERAAKLSAECGGGSLSALPIIQTQSDDLTAYIPTNLISITDGQIFLDTNLFNNGIRPAINIGLSVSRVGGAAQTKAMKQVAGSLKLELAQYEALSAFAQFGSELDKISQRALDRGHRAIEVLRQNQFETYSLTDQILFLTLLKENYLDELNLSDIKPFTIQCTRYIQKLYPHIYKIIRDTQKLEPALINQIKSCVEEFKMTFLKSS